MDKYDPTEYLRLRELRNQQLEKYLKTKDIKYLHSSKIIEAAMEQEWQMTMK